MPFARITIFKSLLCGCCVGYESYLKKEGYKVEMISSDVCTMKEEYGVLEEMESCHTAIMKDYFIKGHIPRKAIKKLIEEKPKIKRIALPGMPEIKTEKFGCIVWGKHN